MVIMSLYSVHNDCNYWMEPHVFLPERHLSLNGELKKERNNFIPFGIGIFYYYFFSYKSKSYEYKILILLFI